MDGRGPDFLDDRETILQDDDQAGRHVPAARVPVPTAASALIKLGDALLGIPVLALREVMVHPPTLQQLPSGGPFAVGCVPLRGQIIPVLDLAGVLRLPDAGATPGIIAILRDAGRVVGIRADAVRRIVQSRDMQVQDLVPAAGSASLNLLPTVALADDEVVNMLDAAALLNCPDVPHSIEGPAQSRNLDRSSQYLLCQIGDWRYCVSVRQIEATLADTAVDSSVLFQGACEGSVMRGGLEMALMNPRVFTGFCDGGDRPQVSAGIVLKLDAERVLTLRTDRISDILHLQRGTFAPVPKALCDRPDLFLGVVFDAARRPCYVIDIERLLEEPEVQSLAALAHRKDADQPSRSTGEGPPGIPGTAILVRAGGLHALPIQEVEEIVPNQPSVINLDPRHDGFIGGIPYRDLLLPVFCMTQLAGGTVAPLGERSGIVVVKAAGEKIGLLVQEIVGIEQVRFVDDAQPNPDGTVAQLAIRAGTNTHRLVSVWRC